MLTQKTILKAVPNILKTVDIPELGEKKQGKVRDIYFHDDKRILITTDRQSAFDVILGHIPYKGAVLNQLAAFWFRKTKQIVKNHLVSVIDPNVSVTRNCQSIPVEMVVRGYMTGVTKTSIWYSYERGERTIYGLKFPEGIKKNQKLPTPVITPTTHPEAGSVKHDERLTREEIISQGIVEEKLYKQMEEVSLALFEYGSKWCKKHGLILVDTKYEFGLHNGKLMLIDEIHTPDSSRFWLSGSYKERFEKGLEPENYDKEFLRLRYANELHYVGDGLPPAMPEDLLVDLSRRYVDVYEMITGKKFRIFDYPVEKRIKREAIKWLMDNEKENGQALEQQQKRLTYKDAGVDVVVGDSSSQQSAGMAKRTFRSEVTMLGSIAGFNVRFSEYTNPYLLGATDGVGTKLKLAFETGVHSTVGVDLVAMCVNDLVRRGADPITFMPYFALQKIDPVITRQLMEGVVIGCQQAGCAIIGGETAEMSDMYKIGEYDLAGSAMGVVDRQKLIDGSAIIEGDVVLGIPSSGLHSNGFTLARKVLLGNFKVDDRPIELEGKTVGEEMLLPTRIYVREVLGLLKAGISLHGVAHITGGGLPSKLGSIVPENLTAKLNKANWKIPAVFGLIQKLGNVDEKEMFKAFNMGIGMVLVVSVEDVLKVKGMIKDVIEIGKVLKRENSVVIE